MLTLMAYLLTSVGWLFTFYEEPRVPVLKNKLKWLMQFEPK